jgi:DNA-binding transcriptional ArsR family regulator
VRRRFAAGVAIRIPFWQYCRVAIFEALAEPHRRAILTMLLERERPVGELVDELGLAQPTVSKHLKSLREAGLVGVRSEGNRRWYRLEPAPLAELDDWLTPFRRRWADRLDALERHLDLELIEPIEPTHPE